LNKTARINLTARRTLISGLCLLALASGVGLARAQSDKVSSASSSTASESSQVKRRPARSESSPKRIRTVLIPGCSSEQGQDMQTGSSPDSRQSLKGGASTGTTVVGARFIRVDRVDGLTYLTYESAGADIVALECADKDTRDGLSRFPITTTREVKGKVPGFLSYGDLVDLEIEPRTKHKTSYTYFPGNPNTTKEVFHWGQEIAEHAGSSSHPVDASLIVSVKKGSVASTNSAPQCLLVHEQQSVAKGSLRESIFSDGTIIVSKLRCLPYGQHPFVEIGILSPARLAVLKDAIAACSFDKMGTNVCCDHPQFTDLLPGKSNTMGDPMREYVMDGRCQSILFSGIYPRRVEDRVRVFKPAAYTQENHAAEISLLKVLAELRALVVGPL
jgi:hypothetical protein